MMEKKTEVEWDTHKTYRNVEYSSFELVSLYTIVRKINLERSANGEGSRSNRESRAEVVHRYNKMLQIISTGSYSGRASLRGRSRDLRDRKGNKEGYRRSPLGWKEKKPRKCLHRRKHWP